MFMTSSNLPIERRRDFFIVTEEDGSKSYYRLVGTTASGELSQQATMNIADPVFDMLKNSKSTKLDLSKTIITKEGIQVGAKEQSEGSLDPDRVDIPGFDTKFQTVTQLATERIPQQTSSSPLPPPALDSPPIANPLANRTIQIDQSQEATNISDFVLSRLKTPRLFLVIRDLFIRLTNPQQYQSERSELEAYEIAQVEKFMTSSNKQINAAALVTVKENFVCIPKGLLNEGDKVTLDKDIGAHVVAGKMGTKYANKDTRLYRNVKSLTTDSGIKVTGYKVDLEAQPGNQVVEGSVIPTVFTHANKDKADHLTNCYMTAHEKQGVIRTGVVDTPQKAKELVAAARKLNTDLGKAPPSPIKKLRIASHQLNTPTRKFVPVDESKMIKNQHKNLAIWEKKMGDVEFAHINTPCNRAYNWGKIFKKIGLGFIFPGEEKSRTQNIEGMTTYLNWAVEDLAELGKNLANYQDNPTLSPEQNAQNKENAKVAADQLKLAVNKLQHGDKDDMGQMVTKKNQIRDNIVEMEKQNLEIKLSQEKIKNDPNVDVKAEKAKIQEAEEKISDLGDEIVQLRRELTDLKSDRFTASLEAKYQALKEIEAAFGKNPLLKEHKETVVLLRQLLGDQLKKPEETLPRGQQLMTYLLLDEKLGVISAMNCKSGLDRTGFVFALKLTMMDTPKDQLFDLVTHWEERAAVLNKRLKAANYDASSFKDPADQAILQFRQRMMTHLLKICLEITVTSTGLIGLKWSKGMVANLIPINFLPAKVKIIKEDNSTEEVQILTYDKDGAPEGLTEIGHRIMTQLSDQRGA